MNCFYYNRRQDHWALHWSCTQLVPKSCHSEIAGAPGNSAGSRSIRQLARCALHRAASSRSACAASWRIRLIWAYNPHFVAEAAWQDCRQRPVPGGKAFADLSI